MLLNYLVTAFRQLSKNRLYSAINILGLVAGLTVYLFGSLLVEYEQSHDAFFEDSDRIYSVATGLSANANVGIRAIDSAYSALGPILEAQIPELEVVSRTSRSEFLVTQGANNFYQTILFVDDGFTDIFALEYVEGDSSALDDPLGILITRSAAEKYFGKGSALGRLLTLDHDKALTVRAVVKDLPLNSHFNSALVFPSSFEFVAPYSLLKTKEFDPEAGNWGSLNLGDLTYIKIPAGFTQEWLQSRIDEVYQDHFPLKEEDFVSGFEVRKLVEANTFLWAAIGMPVIETIQLLALLVLIVAIVNYTNLATAQSLRRTREVGLRKTMGAGRNQLLVQFLVESLLIAGIAMVISLGILELVVQPFNELLGKALMMDYSKIIPWLVTTTLVVGLVAGTYPAYLITRTNPIDALRDGAATSVRGGYFRSLMLGVQFAISIFMTAIVLVVYFQNSKLEESGDIFPRSQVVTLQRLDVDSVQERLDALKNELLTIPGVAGVAFSGQVPFEQRTSRLEVSVVQGEDAEKLDPNLIEVGEGFFALYDIKLLMGRELGRSISDDIVKEDVYSANVVVNKMFLDLLGYSLDSIDTVFYELSDEGQSRRYRIVGVVEDQNFLGFHNQLRPIVFIQQPKAFRMGSIRIKGRDIAATLADIERVWKRVIPDYPVQLHFLDETFENVFKIFAGMSSTLAGFAFLAMALSMVGLFGLAAFMVERRTREIGIRKVMGANKQQIVSLLIWQFSKPVIWACFIALPLAYLASSTYLDFFQNRLPLVGGFVLLAGLLGVLLAWAIVSVHALKVANRNPIHALRYE